MYQRFKFECLFADESKNGMALQVNNVKIQKTSSEKSRQLILPKNDGDSNRNTDTSCSNADSGVASQADDDNESTSKDIEAYEGKNSVVKTSFMNQSSKKDTNAMVKSNNQTIK